MKFNLIKTSGNRGKVSKVEITSLEDLLLMLKENHSIIIHTGPEQCLHYRAAGYEPMENIPVLEIYNDWRE